MTAFRDDFIEVQVLKGTTRPSPCLCCCPGAKSMIRFNEVARRAKLSCEECLGRKEDGRIDGAGVSIPAKKEKER